MNKRTALLLIALCCAGTPHLFAKDAPAAAAAAPQSTPLEITAKTFRQAAEYSREHDGFSALVMLDGKILFEDYAPGRTPDMPAELASGTKSFSGITAIAAQQDGLLKLDEKVSDTITEWKKDPKKSAITIRQLLTLTSGLPGGSVGAPPPYAEALQAQLVATPGTSFHYGPVPFQVFGELMKRKLATKGQTAHDYLQERVLKPAGINVAEWRKGRDGNYQMPSGARMTAREWAKFGQFIVNGGTANGKEILPAAAINQCFKGTKVNPTYGLTFWLNAIDTEDHFPALITGNGLEGIVTQKVVSSPMYVAAGLGKQRLYMIPDQKLIIVRQGKLSGKTFRDDNFLSLLFHGKMAVPEKEAAKTADATTTTPAAAKRAIDPSTPGPLFKRLDKNGDGKLSADEVPAQLKLKELDKNGDGAVSWEEYRSQRSGAMQGAQHDREQNLRRRRKSASR